MGQPPRDRQEALVVQRLGRRTTREAITERLEVAELPPIAAHVQVRAAAIGIGLLVPAAVATIIDGAARIVRVSDREIMAAMRAFFADCHNVVEGAGAAPLAALLQERDRMRGKRVGLVVSGGNIDRPLYMKAMADG